ncbi:MAG TPA: M81 family metallopeptidase [Candidatus Cybelea sp.]|nr:M81 family metallopeptidase [Candidatus Cybelea sp.]
MKVFTATLGTETNTFSPIPTGMQTFAETFLFHAGEHPDHPALFTGPLWAARQRAKERNWQVVEGLCAFAQPAGVTTRKVYEALRDELLEDLRRALPVDMVVLGMHGAMVADGYDDCEGDLLQRMRAMVGPDVPVGAELDPHCHVTARMLEHATALICFKEYPHTDFLERGFELVDLCAAAAVGKTRPVMSVYDCRIISTYHTPVEPMRSFVDRIKALEGKDGVLSVSVAHGFPWGDVADLGTKIVVVTDDRADKGAALAEKLGRELIGLRGKTAPKQLSIDDALERALAIEGGPVVLADTADNAGGGAPSDSTFVLKALLDRGIESAALGPMWDPIAVRLAFEAGEGAHLPLRIGGKVGPVSGQPLDLDVRVMALREDHRQTFGKATAPLGASAVVRVKGIDIVLNSTRTQAFGTDLFTGLGVDLAAKKLIVVKSSQHFYASFAPIAKAVLYVGAPGTLSSDYKRFDYRKVKRPIWPLDDPPPR